MKEIKNLEQNTIFEHSAEISIAEEIMGLARNTLFVEYRFLQRALSHIKMEVYTGANDILFACDGDAIYYDPFYVIGRYKESQNIIGRSILHSLLHCVFHHDWTGKDIDHRLWNLATDMAVENTINEMAKGGPSTVTARETRQKTYLDKLKESLPLLSAENIYKYLTQDLSEDEREKYIQQAGEIFMLDQHVLWMNASQNAIGDEDIEAMRRWQDISKRMQVELETMDSGKEVLCANLQSINRTKRSYAQFLRRFGNHGEIMRLSEDEFDNNYYAYGMELYGNIPLIEYLEYREDKKIKEFVVAIDTSGSVQGETVQKFIQKTYELIKSQESFDVKMKLHIIQCDDAVREDAIITSDAEVDRYINSMQILGLGKTDFRPVFEYVDKLIEERKLTNLAGLLYFTDGNGTFPVKKPSFDTAFIIHSDEVYPPEVPPWAMRLILEDDFQ